MSELAKSEHSSLNWAGRDSARDLPKPGLIAANLSSPVMHGDVIGDYC